jgi:hypothetical protein
MVRGGDSPFETTSVVLLKEQLAALKEIQAARRQSYPGATLSHVIRDVIEEGLASHSLTSRKPFGYSTGNEATLDSESEPELAVPA